MSLDDQVFPQPEEGDDINTRLHVLEMTVAAIAARLPKADMQEIASVLVFVAKGPDTATQLQHPPTNMEVLEEAARHATRMLDRIAKSRGSDRGPAPLPDEPDA